jgi:cell division septum initiation protein DivIVA
MPTRLSTDILAAALAGFEEQKKRLDARIAELRQQLNGGSPASTQGPIPQPTKRRRMSTGARRRIAAAQRRRWADRKAGAGTTAKTATTPVKKKRRLSVAGRKAIIEATKKRWAAVRAAAKKAVRG